LSLNVNSPLSRWVSSLATICGNAIVQAFSLILFARTLGSAEYGVIVAAAATSAVAAEFVGIGSGDLIIREVSRNPEKFAASFGHALRMVAVTFVPVALIATLVTALWFSTDVTVGVIFVLIVGEILTTRIVFMSEQVAIAHHATHVANLVRIFTTFVRLAIVCLAIFAARVTNASAWAPFAAASGFLCAAGSLAFIIRRFGSPQLGGRQEGPSRLGLLFSFMQIIRATQFAIDKFAVGSVAGAAVVGSYGAASRVAQLGVMPASAVTRITYPMFFARGAEGLHSGIQFARRIAPAVLGLGLLSTIGLIAVAVALPYLLGPEFEAAKEFLLMLAILPVVTVLQNLFGDTLTGADLQSRRVVAALVGLALTIACAAAGALLAGVSGAIVGYIAGQICVTAALGLTLLVSARQLAPVGPASAQP